MSAEEWTTLREELMAENSELRATIAQVEHAAELTEARKDDYNGTFGDGVSYALVRIRQALKREGDDE